MTEIELMREIQFAATRVGHRLWRNNVATGWVGTFVARSPHGRVTLDNARPLHAGLTIGSSDLIGISPTGRLLSIEVKSPRGRSSVDQAAWLDMVREFGGLGGVVRSIEEFEAIIRAAGD